MNNWCLNIIEMQGIATMPYFTDGELDYFKIAPMPDRLTNTYFESPEHKQEAIVATLTEGLTIPVKTFSEKRLDDLREYATHCCAHDIAWFIMKDHRQNPPKDKASMPVCFNDYIDCHNNCKKLPPLAIAWIEDWIEHYAEPADVDTFIIKWAEGIETRLRDTANAKLSIRVMQKHGEKYIANYRECGAMTWNDWEMKNWGTTHNAFGTDIQSDDKITFYSYGNPPIPLLRHISANNPKATLTGSYFMEMGEEGTYIIKNRKTISFDAHPFYAD